MRYGRLALLVFLPFFFLAGDTTAGSSDPGSDDARAEVAAFVDRFLSAEDECNSCGTEERCQEGQHDMWNAGGGEEMTGDLHPCISMSCEAHGHESCEAFASLDPDWANQFRQLTSPEHRDLLVQITALDDRVSLNSTRKALQIVACDQVVLHLSLPDEVFVELATD